MKLFVRRPRRLLAIHAAVALAAVACCLVPSAPAVAASTSWCIDGAGTYWYVSSTWGSVYRDRQGVRRLRLSKVRWTTPARRVPTAARVEIFDGEGRGVQTLTYTRTKNYKIGRSGVARNPVDPLAAGRPYVRVTLGRAKAKGCTVLVDAPRAGDPLAVRKVPASVADDCSADVTAALTRWIGSAPARSRLEFAAGGCYRVDGTVEVQGRKNIVIDGRKATLRSTAPMKSGRWRDDQRAMFRVVDSSGVTFTAMNIVGAYGKGGRFDEGLQHAHGIDVRGSSVTVRNVRLRALAGDCVYFGLGSDQRTLSSGAVLDSHCTGVGRNGISVTGGRDVTVSGSHLGEVGWNAFDVEPNRGPNWRVERVRISRNTIGGFGVVTLGVVQSAPIDSIAFVNNRTVARKLRIAVGDPFRAGFRTRRVVIAGNTSHTGQALSAVVAEKVDVLTVVHNQVGMTGGALASVDRSCRVTVRYNASGRAERQVVVSRPSRSC